MREIIEEAVNDPVFDQGDGVKVYACGFLLYRAAFSTQVALIKKLRPTWQAGKFNGIGGRVEEGESPAAAMTREFMEETGVTVLGWRCFALLKHGDNLVYMFTAEVTVMKRLTQMTDEHVQWLGIPYLQYVQRIANLDWLIPMAMSKNTEVAVIQDDTPFSKAA
jgi:8-oxo-dGTP diphosphatase